VFVCTAIQKAELEIALLFAYPPPPYGSCANYCYFTCHLKNAIVTDIYNRLDGCEKIKFHKHVEDKYGPCDITRCINRGTFNHYL